MALLAFANICLVGGCSALIPPRNTGMASGGDGTASSLGVAGSHMEMVVVADRLISVFETVQNFTSVIMNQSHQPREMNLQGLKKKNHARKLTTGICAPHKCSPACFKHHVVRLVLAFDPTRNPRPSHFANLHPATSLFLIAINCQFYDKHFQGQLCE